MATCPSCGKEQNGTSAFCTSCGAVLDRPNLGAPQAQPTLAGASVEPAILLVPSRAAADFGDIGQYIARRLFALFVDLLGVTVLVAIGVAYIVARRGEDTHSFSAFFETALYTLFVMIVYLCIAEAYLATTLGKALMGLRVRVMTSPRVGIVRGVVRNIFLPFDLLVIGFVLAALTPRRKRIGDFVAGTEVVNARRPALYVVAAAVLIGAWAYAEYAYGDGLRTAQTLENAAATYGPTLVGGQGAPPTAPTPLPERTAVPTEQPITVPTIAPSGAAGSPSASPATSPAASGAATSTPSPPSSPQAAPAQTPSPASTTS